MKEHWYKRELFWFIAVVTASIIPLFFVKYAPSLDGPQHLYSVNLLRNLLKGNEAVHEYFRINPVIVGYWGGHFFLGLFHLFLPAYLAEKVFIVFYLLGMYFSFRYLIAAFRKKISMISLFIIPFAFNHFFILGYYSFCMAIIPFFLFFGYLIRNEEKLGKKQLLVIFLLLLSIYLSHAIIFVFTGFVLLIYLISKLVFELIEGKIFRVVFRSFLIRSLKILIAALPAIVLFVIYYRHVEKLSNVSVDYDLSFTDRLQALLKVSLLYGFRVDLEQYPLIGMFLLLIIVTVWKMYQIGMQCANNGRRNTFRSLAGNYSNIWFVVSMIMLLVYCFVPDDLTTGNLSKRAGLFFYITLIVWLAQKSFSLRLQFIILVPFLIFMTHRRILIQNMYIEHNDIIAEIEEAGEHMEPDAVFFPINESTSWLSNHFICYAGVDKLLINMKAPQSDGQFPVSWNQDRIPMNYFGDSLIRHGISFNYQGDAPRKVKIADYAVWLDHEVKHVDSISNARFDRIIKHYYDLEYVSSESRVRVYRLSCRDTLEQIRKGYLTERSERLERWRTEAENRNLDLNSYLLIKAIEEYGSGKQSSATEKLE